VTVTVAGATRGADSPRPWRPRPGARTRRRAGRWPARWRCRRGRWPDSAPDAGVARAAAAGTHRSRGRAPRRQERVARAATARREEQSQRQIAANEGVRRAQVRRDLAEAESQVGPPAHLGPGANIRSCQTKNLCQNLPLQGIVVMQQAEANHASGQSVPGVLYDGQAARRSAPHPQSPPGGRASARRPSAPPAHPDRGRRSPPLRPGRLSPAHPSGPMVQATPWLQFTPPILPARG
jgi:hypothetical protein